jgi:hypothetical protein
MLDGSHILGETKMVLVPQIFKQLVPVWFLCFCFFGNEARLVMVPIFNPKFDSSSKT